MSEVEVKESIVLALPITAGTIVTFTSLSLTLYSIHTEFELLDMKDLRNYSLLHHNTFGIDARCRRFVEIETVEEAQRLPSVLKADDRPLMVIGGGSNLLLTKDFEGTVLHAAIRGTEANVADDGSVLLRVGSGETWDDIVALCVERGWYGAENLSLIPGEVGATAVQNIGAYGVEVASIIYNVEAVEIATGRLVSFRPHECGYGYRQSRFKQEWHGKYLITHVTYRLQTTFVPHLDYGNLRERFTASSQKPTPQALRQAIIDIRREKLPDPLVEGNAGSFFVNPVVSREKSEELLRDYPAMPHYDAEGKVKIPAGWLIEQCGWKGRSLGRAGVHGRQALVLVNRGGATGADIVALCEAIRHDVKEKFGIDIHPEVNIV